MTVLPEVDLPFDINFIVDAVVPVYTAVVFVIIASFAMTKSRTVKKEKYALKRKTTSSVKKDWKEQMTGKFQQVECEGLNDWLIFLKKPYPVRLLAPKMFLMMINEISFKDGKFNNRISFLEKNDKVEIYELDIASTKDEAVKKDYPTEEDQPGYKMAWINEGEQAVWYETAAKQNPEIVLQQSREMLDEDTIEVVSLLSILRIIVYEIP